MLRRIQADLAGVYDLAPDFDVASFVVARSDVEGALDRPEQVLVKQDDDGLEVALVLDDALIEHSGPIGLDAYCACAEGVSHLLYVALAAERGTQITRLELELQAEIDKFALLLFAFGWRSAELIRRLFLTSRVRDSVECAMERSRYVQASRLALGYCSHLLARWTREGKTEPLLADLRRVYRMGGERKLAYVRSTPASG